MKKTLCFFLMIMVSVICLGQVPSTIKGLHTYLANNIANLRPFEGIYNVVVHSYDTATRSWTTYNHQWGMYYTETDSKYHEVRYESDNTLTEMRTYKYNPETQIFSNYNGTSPIKVSDPNKFVREQDDRALAGVFLRIEYEKSYPTPKMYEDAWINAQINKASEYGRQKNYSAALSILDEVINIRKGPREYGIRAITYYFAGNYNSAIKDCDMSLSLANAQYDSSMTYYVRGLCYLYLGDEVSGITDMKKAGDKGVAFLEDYYKQKKTRNDQHNSQKPKTIRKSAVNRQNKSTPILKKTK